MELRRIPTIHTAIVEEFAGTQAAKASIFGDIHTWVRREAAGEQVNAESVPPTPLSRSNARRKNFRSTALLVREATGI